MRLKLLGTAAGGGFPQWNCSCPNCSAVRAGVFRGVSRTQTQLAWEAGPRQWTLLNASPDLGAQIGSCPELWPLEGTRLSPVRDVILPGAELDQALGLLLLREFHRFRVHATASVRKILTEDNSLFDVLARFPGQVCWSDIPIRERFSAGGMRMEAITVPGSFPGFVSSSRVQELKPDEAVIGLLLAPASGGRTLGFFPQIACVPSELMERLQDCDVLLFDGTFWNDTEPLSIPGVTRTARQMGHLPVAGHGGSLEQLAALQHTRKIFIHINNTNSMLDEGGPEYREALDSGWEMAKDNMEIYL